MNLHEMSDEELDALRVELLIEQERRNNLAQIPSLMEQANRTFLAAEGVADGSEWRQPLGAFDAYPLGWTVTHDGKTWVALRNGASGEPGIGTGDWQEYQEPGEVVEWVQPQAGSEYPVGALVRHNGRIFENTHSGPNGWEPGTIGSQWTDRGPTD